MREDPDPARIAARLDALWAIAHGPGGGANRPAYSLAEAQAMRLVAGWAREAGLEPALDEFGNLWALDGWGSDSGPVVTSTKWCTGSTFRVVAVGRMSR